MPVRYSIQVKRAVLVRQGLQQLKGDVVRIGQQDMYDAMLRARDRVVSSPPEQGGSSYVRTGTYEHGWTVRKNPSGGRVLAGYSLIGQAVGPRGQDYTKYVGGDAYGQSQARIHQGRWNPARDSVDKEMEQLPRTEQDHLDSVARRVL